MVGGRSFNQRKRGKQAHKCQKKYKKANSPTQQKTGADPKVIELAKDKLNVRYKVVQRTIDAHTKKRIEQVARKTIRIATKVKNPKTFEQRYKTVDGKLLSNTPHTAWVQTFGKQPRLVRNSGAAFVRNPLIYGPCRPSRLNYHVAYKCARRSGPCLRFLDIENPNLPQHAMFKEDETTGLTVKQMKKQTLRQQTSSPTKRKAKATGKRTGERPTIKLQTRVMSLQTDDRRCRKKKDSTREARIEPFGRQPIHHILGRCIPFTKTAKSKENTTSTGTPKEVHTKPPTGANKRIWECLTDKYDQRTRKQRSAKIKKALF